MGNKHAKFNKLNPNNSKSNDNHTPQEEKDDIIYDQRKAELNERVLNSDDFGLILECGQNIKQIFNPCLFIISHKSDNTKKVVDNDYANKEHICIFAAQGQKQMKQQISNKLKQFNNNKIFTKYDGIIVVLLCLTQTFTDPDTNLDTYKFYYDGMGVKRHVDKLRKDIAYRIDDTLKFYMHYDTTIINTA
eukprot:831065_1